MRMEIALILATLMLAGGCTTQIGTPDDYQMCGMFASCPRNWTGIPIGFDCIRCHNPANDSNLSFPYNCTCSCEVKQ